MHRAVPLEVESISASHWSLSAPNIEAFPALDTSLECDVGVIGAGYTGLVSALTLAASGRRVIVLEAQQPGWGASGRNVGQIIPMAWGARKGAEFVLTKLGAERGSRMNRVIATSGRTLFDFISRHQIVCDAQPGYVCVMRTEESWRKWQAIFSAWREFGGRFEVLDRSELQRYVVSPRYAGGVFLPEGGRLNPLSFARGMSMALIKAGGRIFGDSRAVAVERLQACWRIKTARGSVRCETVLVGAGAYTDALFPVLRKVGLPVLAGAVATDPLPDKGASILPAGLPMADLDDPAVFTPTLDAQGCLVLSYLIGSREPAVARALKVLGPRLQRAFPQFAPPPFKRIWAGKFLIGPDGMPRLLRLDRGLYAGAVCNGLGHTLGVAVALELARLAMGSRDEELNFPVQAPRPTPGAGFMPTMLRRVVFPLLNRTGA